MAFDPAFLELMPFTCTLSAPGVLNGAGEATTTGATITPHCHVQYGDRRSYGEGKEVTLERGIVYLDGVYPVTTSWTMSVPSPGGAVPVKIVAVDQNTDEEGWHHTAVRFGDFGTD